MKSSAQTQTVIADPAGGVQAHRHICILYHSEEEAYEVLGLLGSKAIHCGFCFVLVNDQFSPLELRSSFRKHGLSVDIYRSCSKILRTDEFYVAGDTISYESCRSSIEKLYDNAIEGGFSGVYRFTDMSWIVNGLSEHIQQMMLLENMLNSQLDTARMINFSLFNVHRFDATTMLDVLSLYPSVYCKGVISPNPFYLGVNGFVERYSDRHFGEIIQRNQLLSYISKE